jgi:signal transduction histidine kinase
MHGNYWRALLKYGLWTGLLLSFVVLFRYWLILPLSQPVSYAENIAMLAFMFLFVWLYRKGLEKQKISFKEGYIVAFGLGIVASIIYGMFLFVYSYRIDPAMQERCFEVQRNLPNNINLSDGQVRFMTKPSYIAFAGILLSSVLSIIWAMVVAIILRNEKAEVVQSKNRIKKRR